MLTRQKIILSLLVNANGLMSRMVLVKLAFLMRQEDLCGPAKTFYDFVPYRFGPFSFTLYRELNTLERNGYISTNEESVKLQPGAAASVRQKVEELPKSIRCGVVDLIEHYARMGQRELVQIVYNKYPWYASQSELKDIVPHKAPPTRNALRAVYTVGYAGKSVDYLLNQLLSHGIRSISDVRSNAVSRKYGFARNSLSGIAKKLGLEYQHWPQLGIPGQLRQEVGDYASRQRLLNCYEKEILPKQGTSVARLARSMSDKPSALLCMEKDVRWCHRSRLANHVSQFNGLPVIHL